MSDTTLGAQQELFARLLPRLLDKAHELGFAVRIGEVWRPPQQAAYYASKGRGILKSRHVDKCAVDLNLFRDGVFLTQTEDHAALGAWWVAQHVLARWGGNFKKRDGNHYSIADPKTGRA